jgi:O-antigen/teichoic acid export membrane protein
VRRYWDRPLGSKLIILLSFALLVEMLAPWQRICAVTSGDQPRICGWRTAYEGTNFGLYAALLAAAIFVWELLPVLIPRLSMRGWPTAVVTAILSVAVALCLLVKLIEDNEFQTIWAWIGFAIGLTLMLTALIRVRFRWEMRHKPEKPAPAERVAAPHAEPPPGGGSPT